VAASALQRKIEQFFRRYQRRFQRALDDPHQLDTDAIAGAFADYFVQSGPAGVYGGKNGLRFKFMLGRGFARYRKISMTSMRIDAIEVTALDPAHALAKVSWDSRYRRRKDGAQVRIVFANLYFLRLRPGPPKIFGYVTGDEEGVLKKHGLS